MAVVIDSGPVAAEDPLRIVPREKWHDLMLARRHFMEVNLSHDCRCLVQFVDDAKLMYSELGFANVEEMIREGYQLEAEEISVALEWLRLNPPDQPVSFDTAIKLGKRGRPRNGEKKGDNVTLKERGNSRIYILARLDRDGKTDLAAKVRDGELSANAAAIEAGFRKKPIKRCPKCGHEW